MEIQERMLEAVKDIPNQAQRAVQERRPYDVFSLVLAVLMLLTGNIFAALLAAAACLFWRGYSDEFRQID